MEYFYSISAIVCLITCIFLGFLTRPKTDSSTGAPSGFRAFQIRYILAWAICVAADWLQGPYVYALYEAYGYSRAENARLFVAGFGASFVFGTFVAGVADSVGRKKAVLLYCVLYSISCMTKHFNQYSMLMVGRVTGGIATSLLFSAFESWLVSEHNVRHKFPAKLLAYSFSMMYFVNYLVAISVGVSADVFITMMPLTPVFGEGGVVHMGGYLLAFDLAIVSMVIGGVYVALNWDENYGESNGALEAVKDFGRCAILIGTNIRMLLCCAVVACFESSMYLFVFNWTPVLHQGDTVPPFGLIFSTFMMCCMAGTSLFALRGSTHTTIVLFGAVGCALVALAVPSQIGISDDHVRFNFWALLVFECCVGVYFPAICTLKSEVVPESHRSTVYNLFRAPMNLIVITVLLLDVSLESTFRVLVGLLLLAVISLTPLLLYPAVDKNARETDALLPDAEKSV